MPRYDPEARGPLDQGDILLPFRIKSLAPWWLDDNELPLVVMTPTCDIAQQKAEHHRFCVLQPFCFLLYEIAQQAGLEKDHWDGTKEVGKGKSNDIRGQLKKAMRNAWPRYHFLPKEAGCFETDYLIDFELVLTAPLDYFDEARRRARINPPFQQELVQRYAAHVMRIGTPDVDAAAQDASIAGCLAGTSLRLAA